MVIYVHRSSCKVPAILVRFEQNFISVMGVSEKSSNIEFHENPASGSTQRNRETYMTKLIVAFCERA